MEKLQPQIEKSNLVVQSQVNYNIAQNYYAQRRAMFRQYLYVNSINATNIEGDIGKAVENIWNKQIFNVISGIYWSGRNSGASVASMKAQVDAKFQLSESVMKHIYHAIAQGNPRNFYSSLGFAFENWIAEYGIGPILQKGTEFVDSHGEDLINTFVSGALKSRGSAVSGIKNIRSDVLISHYTETDFKQDDGGVLRTPANLPMELQSKMKIDWEQAIPSADEIMSDHSILQEFLQSGQGDVYGLSAKSWTDSNGKEFMKSSVMQKMLNATFNQVDSKGKRHSWQPDYTMEYVVYFLSHRIFDIIGPTTVALISRNGITWMDDFLTQHIFYMQVQLEKYWKKKDGGLGRVYPQITNPGVYVRNYSIASASAFKAKQHRTKKNGHYIDLKVT